MTPTAPRGAIWKTRPEQRQPRNCRQLKDGIRLPRPSRQRGNSLAARMSGHTPSASIRRSGNPTPGRCPSSPCARGVSAAVTSSRSPLSQPAQRRTGACSARPTSGVRDRTVTAEPELSASFGRRRLSDCLRSSLRHAPASLSAGHSVLMPHSGERAAPARCRTGARPSSPSSCTSQIPRRQPVAPLILDNLTARVVADVSGLPHLVDRRGRSERWTAYRYGVYLDWMTLVSAKLDISPDLLEYALFTEGRRRRR